MSRSEPEQGASSCEVEPATQDELRQDLKSLFQGAIRLTLEMDGRSATIRAGRQPEGPQERDVSEAPAYGSDRRDGPAQPGRRLARRRDGSLPAQDDAMMVWRPT